MLKADIIKRIVLLQNDSERAAKLLHAFDFTPISISRDKRISKENLMHISIEYGYQLCIQSYALLNK